MTTTYGIQPSVKLYDLHPPIEDFRAEVLAGLTKQPKSISPKFLYDKQGAELFDQICILEEYYLTRTEMLLLQVHAAEIAELIGEGVLIEFGSGSSQKIRILLDAMLETVSTLPIYVALDISKQHLQESCLNLVETYPGLETIAICTDYTQSLHLPEIPAIKHKHRTGFFPGSSIGNLQPEEAIEFLKNAATLLQPEGGLLIGVDLKKSKAILEPAYDDAKGISAAFALNLLVRMNRELGTDFDLNDFAYRAFYNPLGRIEMYLVSLKEQTVHLGETILHFGQDETLRTEYSYKYSTEEFQELAQAAGFQPKRVWIDPQQLFSLHYLVLK
jgi:dimethylhistidine N-methyltransferase